MSLRNAFPQSRSFGNVMYPRVSCSGYLNFRLRLFKFLSGKRYESGSVNAIFRPVFLVLLSFILVLNFTVKELIKMITLCCHQEMYYM